MPEPSTRTVEADAAAHERMKEALAQVQAPWDAARTERTLRTLPVARRKKRARRAVGGGLVAALLLGPVLWLGSGRNELPSASLDAHGRSVPTLEATSGHAVDAAKDTRQLRLTDGSTVVLMDARTDVSVERVDEHLVSLALREGRARFEVSARPERVFRVRTAEVTVEVLGTIFEVEQQAARTRVQVTRGRVAVSWADQRAILVAGDERVFPLPGSAASQAGAPSSVDLLPHVSELELPSHLSSRGRAAKGTSSSAALLARPNVHSSPRHARDNEAPDSWREHAEGGDFKSAFPLLPKTDTMATMSVSDLMLAADAARLSGHPREALPYLTRVVEAHPDDTRAPLAAFTLGGVLMHQLGLPREAEAAYARARATTPSEALAQDALARQVEAASRAGDEVLAQRLARVYLEKYPEGRRVNAVRRFGRL
jgi:transmembrane sensor